MIKAWLAFPLGLLLVSPALADEEWLIQIPGGTFTMGDPWDEGAANEKPLHLVRLDPFYLGRCEVTVGEFARFAKETGYVTSAERFDSREAQADRLARARTMMEKGPSNPEAMQTLLAQILASGGCFVWQPERGGFDFSLDCNWAEPLFPQSPRDPVVCMSWNDAAAYCNWLSTTEELPPAYDLETGRMLDAQGAPTTDVTRVEGYRLPTEAEWEYAAREGGRKVRFGNGRDTARASEIAFDAGRGDYGYVEKGRPAAGTSPVGSFPPNALGLHDMSGNAWEWCSDGFGSYSPQEAANPCAPSGPRRVLRGGRWGGDGREARVFARVHYEAHNRCNNAGFRIARSGP